MSRQAKNDRFTTVPTQDRCHHANQHWVGNGELCCELPKGHAGNHQADYMRGDGVTARGEWTDMAGTPVEEFERDLQAQVWRRIEAAIENQKQADAEMENQAKVRGRENERPTS